LQRDFGEIRKELIVDTLKNVSTWTTRACDWYNSERRIIFATKSKKDRANWIKFFKKHAIVKPYNQPELEEINNISRITDL
jgi:hypothetical protein